MLALKWIAGCLALPVIAVADDVRPTVFEKPQVDARVKMIRSLHEGSGFQAYADKDAWLKRSAYLRQQVLIAAGLWPMAERTPLNAQVYGGIDRDDYTVEKVHFESYPGFYVTGNLYRPKGKRGPFPAVLSPHGHWENGRLYEAPDKEVARQIAGGWEKDKDAAKYPMQARCANLAKLGCVVFFYDMVGYADAAPDLFPHRQTYRTVDDDLHLLSVFGLQTWDSIRALEFIESLPDVDRSRIGITGASGGATQTFMMMATQDDLAAAAPVCMISAGEHQGGCVCENNALLRVGTDNVELTATFAPRPFIHPTATGDWTHEYLEQGFPETKATYKLFGAEGNVESFRQQSGHNYNLHSREAVYNFFNTRLKLGHDGSIEEQHFAPVPPKDLHVWDGAHPRPSTAADAAALKKYFVEMTARQLEGLKPKDAEGLKQLREVMEPALRHMLSTRLPDAGDVSATEMGTENHDTFTVRRLTIQRREDKQAIPALLLSPNHETGARPKIYVSAGGKGDFVGKDGKWAGGIETIAAVQPVLLIDVFGTGELSAKPAATRPEVEFFAGYNRTALANRVHDTLTAVAYLRSREKAEAVDVVAAGEAGMWAVLAKALAGPAVGVTKVSGQALSFAVSDAGDANYLPGSLRYGGVGPMAALCAPGELHVTDLNDAEAAEWMRAAYAAAGAGEKLHVEKR